MKRQEFFEHREAQGVYLDYSNVHTYGGVSEQTRRCIENDDFSESFEEPNISAPYTRHTRNHTPIVSAAMDTVTEAATAIVMADGGGRGTIHYGLSPEAQFKQLEKVKKHINGFIDKPKTLSTEASFEDVRKLENRWHFSNFPVIDADGRLAGLVTKDRSERSTSIQDLVSQLMIPADRLRVVRGMIELPEAYKIMLEEDINILPIIDDNFGLLGLYTFKDAKREIEEKDRIQNVDENGHYVCDIAVPTDDTALERLELCAPYLWDGGGVIVLDTASGDGFFGFKYLREIKKKYHDDIDIMVGNITNGESAVLLAQMGADGIKVGQASGGVCTTYEETGIGRGQLSALWDVVHTLKQAKYGDLPVCSDGGVKMHGHPPKALATGASSVMIGTEFGATDEASGPEVEMPDGSKGKIVRGMGSEDAIKVRSSSAAQRYDHTGKPLAEGKAKPVPLRGPLAPILRDFRLAIRKSFNYAGAVTLQEFQEKVRFELRLSGD